MKQVTIKQMTLHYFKGIRNATYDFADRTTVTGPNGSGKSTIMDAFFWCLWGKNAAGRADFLIKTVDKDGQEIPHIEHQVTLTLEVNGEQVVFDRTLVPEYDRNDNLKGNHTDYTWNSVPMKKSEYDQKVSEVITEDVFKLIASPTAFLNMDWQKQRATLMKIAGEVSSQSIAETLDNGPEGDYHYLLELLKGKSLDEYKRELDSKLKKVNESMQSIPARIDEVTRNTPEKPDLAAIKEQRQQLEQQLDDIESYDREIAKSYEAMNADRIKLTKEISDLETQRMMMVNEAEAKERNAIHAANQTYIKAEAEYKGLKAEEDLDMGMTNSQQKTIQAAIDKNSLTSEQMKQGIDTLREEWLKEKATQFSGTDNLECPLYGHACTDPTSCERFGQDQNGAYQAFAARKQSNLSNIDERGKKMSQQIKELLGTIDKQIAELNVINSGLTGRCQVRHQRMEELEKLMKANPKKPLIAHVDPMTIPGIKELDSDIADKKDQLSRMSEYKPLDSGSAARIKALREQLEALGKEEAKQLQIDAAEGRIEQLQYELAELGAEKAELETLKRHTIDFEVASMNAISDKVNSMFTLVRFQMFQRQVNGEEVPACICMVDGVRWQDANTAARMNAGIDVAAVLANAAKSFAPVFIDNAESNGSIYVPKGLPIQQIRLAFDPAATKLTINRKR